jgi:hypothetical protein
MSTADETRAAFVAEGKPDITVMNLCVNTSGKTKLTSSSSPL